MEGFAYRMAQRMELARDRALQRNREWGLYINGGEYQFAEFNELTQTWEPYTQRPFHTESYAMNVQMDCRLTSIKVEWMPTKTLYRKLSSFSSGEVTPFELTIKHITQPSLVWILESDGFTCIKAQREDL